MTMSSALARLVQPAGLLRWASTRAAAARIAIVGPFGKEYHDGTGTHGRSISSSPYLSSSDSRYPAIAAGHGPWPFASAPAQFHPSVRPLAQAYPSHLHIQVQWGDQDAFGHLNNVSLMRYFESVRMQYLIDFSRHLPEGQRHSFAHPTPGFPGPIVANVTTRYRAQVHYPDTLTYFLRVSEKDVDELKALISQEADGAGSTKDRVVLEYVAFSHRQGVLVADGTCTLVVFDYGKQRKTPITPEIARAVVRWEEEGRRKGMEVFGKAEYMKVE
ncbi:HotDog domain-containing protein [Catenaria anguillulae PL171]|uniref:HotDog domain-containing protein n=1 Tax=Catenaria anguillulae PL171 TaxID=765915 RepID=A0A1Y2HUT6_9FUNG|nr:HotDog domain-containing protein [Catenaria anguillulae PL171]